ncbi:MAG: FMN-binding negative transcriptional regulator [Rhodobacteraceae bacterium]|nr:FMN-binding negative transcriptional regulator [Paracoccaceae bacterium]
MHPNPAFHTRTDAHNLAFARDRGFGVLAVADGDGAPHLAHVPFLLGPDGIAHLHLVRSNPIARALQAGERAARIAVSGPDGYISPDWYGIDDQVPTWNYIAVHLTGDLRLAPESGLSDLLDRQSAFYESRLAPKPPWTADKMSPGTMERMMRQIVPCTMTVRAVDGTWKMSQNKPEAARHAAGARVADAGIGSDTATLADWMRDA